MKLFDLRCFRLSLLAIVGALSAFSALLPIETAAQAQAEAANATPVCMTRVSRDSQTIFVILPTSDIPAMKAKGFVAAECEKAFVSDTARQAYRDEICHAASTLSRGVLEDLERHLGENPAVLCGMAEAAVGQWQRERSE